MGRLAPAAATAAEPRRHSGAFLPWVVVFGFTIVAGIGVRWAVRDRGVYEIWADRDLGRAAALAQEPQFSGAEFTGGGRTPGGFYYVLLAGALKLGRSPSVVHALTIALDVAALVALGLSARRNLGTAAGLATAAFQAASPASLELLRTVAYNPTLALPFGVLAYALFLDVLAGARRWRLPLVFLAVALAAQVHLSYALLAPLFAGALVLRRVRVGWRPWAVALLVFVGSYAPFLVAEAKGGAKILAEIRLRQHLRPPAAPVVAAATTAVADSAAGNLARVVFGFAAPFATPLHLAGRTLQRIGVWRAFPMLIVAAFALDRLRGLLARGGRTESPPSARAGVTMAFLIVAGLLLVGVKNTSFAPRYVMFLLPGAALLYGAAFQSYADALARSGGAGRAILLNVVLLYWAAMFGNANTLTWYAHVPTPTLTVAGWERLIPEIQDRLGLDRVALARSVTVLDLSTGRWKPLLPTHDAAAYFIDAFASPGHGEGDGKCALVLAPYPLEVAVTATDVAAALGAFPAGLVPSDARTVSAEGSHTIVEYRLPGGNCLHGMNDRYALTPEERTIAATAGEGVKEVAGTGDRRFVLTLRGRNPAGRPLRMMTVLAAREGSVTAAIESNELRGYDGISSFRLVKPAVVLRGRSGEWRIPILEGTLGGWFNPVLTPWRSPATAVPPGSYEASLTFSGVAFEELAAVEGGGAVLLTPALELPPSAPQSAAAAIPAPPPPARESPGKPSRGRS